MASSRRDCRFLPVVTVQSRRYFGITSLPRATSLMPCFSAIGRNSIEMTVASATLPSSALKRSGSLPRLANLHRRRTECCSARSQALPIMSGVAFGAEIAMVAPFMSAALFSSSRANTLCTTVCQWQPMILTSALRAPAMMAVAAPPS